MRDLALVLHQLATDLRCEAYTEHYARDLPDLFARQGQSSAISENSLRSLQKPSYFTCNPPDVTKWLLLKAKSLPVEAFPFIASVNEKTKNVIAVSGKPSIFDVYLLGFTENKLWLFLYHCSIFSIFSKFLDFV